MVVPLLNPTQELLVWWDLPMAWMIMVPIMLFPPIDLLGTVLPMEVMTMLLTLVQCCPDLLSMWTVRSLPVFAPLVIRSCALRRTTDLFQLSRPLLPIGVLRPFTTFWQTVSSVESHPSGVSDNGPEMLVSGSV